MQKQSLMEIEGDFRRLKDFLIHCENLIEECEQTTIDEKFFVYQSLDEKLRAILREKQAQTREILQLKSDLIDEKTRWKSLQDHQPSNSTFLSSSDETLDQQSNNSSPITFPPAISFV